MTEISDLPVLPAGYGYVVTVDGKFVVDKSGAFVIAQGPLVPINIGRVDYIFRFQSELKARTDSIVGPYFNPSNENMLLDLWVYDLVTGQTLDGFWFLIMQPATVTALANSANLILEFDYPGPTLIQNKLDPSIGDHFTIIAGQLAQPYINDWSQV